jgi:hypothetical protein
MIRMRTSSSGVTSSAWKHRLRLRAASATLPCVRERQHTLPTAPNPGWLPSPTLELRPRPLRLLAGPSRERKSRRMHPPKSGMLPGETLDPHSRAWRRRGRPAGKRSHDYPTRCVQGCRRPPRPRSLRGRHRRGSTVPKCAHCHKCGNSFRASRRNSVAGMRASGDRGAETYEIAARRQLPKWPATACFSTEKRARDMDHGFWLS